jgi:hypothetical protein
MVQTQHDRGPMLVPLRAALAAFVSTALPTQLDYRCFQYIILYLRS